MRRGDRGPEQLFEKGPMRHLDPGRGHPRTVTLIAPGDGKP
jgi:hypothetical protein